MLKYAIIGTGAIGGYYGAKLARAGHDVHFLLHSDYEYVKQNGLEIDSVNGSFLLKDVNAYSKTTDMPQCDVVLVGLKSTNNHLLKEMLPPLLHKNTIVILIQNGLGLEEDLQKDFPALHIAGGLAFICSNKTGPGHITHFAQGKLNIGSYSCPDTGLLERISNDFRQSGVETDVLGLEEARWRKLVWNIPYNGISVVLNTTTDKLTNDPDSCQLLRNMMIEVINAGNKVGQGKFVIKETFADKMIEATKAMAAYSPSMKLDFDAQRPLEIGYIYSCPILAAQEAGCEMPRVSMLEKQLSFIQRQYLKGIL